MLFHLPVLYRPVCHEFHNASVMVTLVSLLDMSMIYNINTELL